MRSGRGTARSHSDEAAPPAAVGEPSLSPSSVQPPPPAVDDALALLLWPKRGGQRLEGLERWKDADAELERISRRDDTAEDT